MYLVWPIAPGYSIRAYTSISRGLDLNSENHPFQILASKSNLRIPLSNKSRLNFLSSQVLWNIDWRYCPNNSTLRSAAASNYFCESLQCQDLDHYFHHPHARVADSTIQMDDI